MTEHKDPLICFVNRTKCNLGIIQKLSSNGEPPYEVTQLVNSLLGLVLLPQQSLFSKIPHTPFNNLRTEGWPSAFLKSSTRSDLHDNLHSLLICLRNGIAHFNIKLHGDGESITKVTILDRANKNPSPHWEVSLSIDDLKQIVDQITLLVLRLHTNQNNI